MTDLTLPDGVKMTRETLCAAQASLIHGRYTYDRADEHIERLGLLILELNRHRPLGPNGKHGDRHTATCGCDDGRPTPTQNLRLSVGETCPKCACVCDYGPNGPCRCGCDECGCDDPHVMHPEEG